jgi:hypothetical protein
MECLLEKIAYSISRSTQLPDLPLHCHYLLLEKHLFLTQSLLVHSYQPFPLKLELGRHLMLLGLPSSHHILNFDFISLAELPWSLSCNHFFVEVNTFQLVISPLFFVDHLFESAHVINLKLAFFLLIFKFKHN